MTSATDLNLKIRKAGLNDLEAILGLWEELFSLHAGLDPIFTTADDGREHYRRWLLANIEEHDSFVLVAELDGQVVAYVLAQIQILPPTLPFRQIGMVSDMAVTRRLRGQGIGRRLFGDLEARFIRRGVGRLEVKTSSFNPASNHFWEKVCGFTEFVKLRCKELG